MGKAIAAKSPCSNVSMVRNIEQGETLEQVSAYMAAEYPGWAIEVIGRQGFGAEPAGGPESYMMPGY